MLAATEQFLVMLGTVIAGLVTTIGVIVASYFSFLAHRQAKEANDAVNHRHEGGHPRLFDMVVESRANQAVLMSKQNELLEWKRSYTDSGGEWDNGNKVHQFIESHSEFCKETKDKLHQHSAAIRSMEKSIEKHSDAIIAATRCKGCE